MTEILDDVMEAAREALRIGFGQYGSTKLMKKLEYSVDSAILAERERCAKVADSHPNAHHTAIRDAILHQK